MVMIDCLFQKKNLNFQMQIFYKLFYNPIKIRILNYSFGKYNIKFYPKKIKFFLKKYQKNKKNNEVIFFKDIFDFKKMIIKNFYIFMKNNFFKLMT